MTGKSLQLSKYGTAATANKQTSPTDTTAGRLMPVGAFGLGKTGQPTVIADVDDFEMAQGLYDFATTTTLGAFPLAGGGVLLHWVYRNRNGNRFVFQELRYNSFDGGRMFKRTYNGPNDSWDDWQELYHTGNILGTVSQSGGVPTGAIIERGSNSNGEYVKFADGTMFCVREVVLDMESGDTQSFSYAKTFATGAEIAGSFSGKDTGSIVTSDDRLTAHASLALIAAPSEWVARFANTATGSGMQIFTLFAKGRWY